MEKLINGFVFLIGLVFMGIGLYFVSNQSVGGVIIAPGLIIMGVQAFRYLKHADDEQDRKWWYSLILTLISNAQHNEESIKKVLEHMALQSTLQDGLTLHEAFDLLSDYLDKLSAEGLILLEGQYWFCTQEGMSKLQEVGETTEI